MATAKLRQYRRYTVDIRSGSGTSCLKDISMGGMRVLSDQALRIFELVEMAIPAGDRQIRVKGRIVRSLRSGSEEFPFEYGLEFEELEDQAKQQLQQFLDELAEQADATKAVDHADVDSLRGRLSELEWELAVEQRGTLAMARPAASGAGAEPAAAAAAVDPGPDAALQTQFDRDRFTHLVHLGQPLMPLVEDVAARLEGEEISFVTGAISECFSLTKARRSLSGSHDDEAIIQALYACYQQQLIDFA